MAETSGLQPPALTDVAAVALRLKAAGTETADDADAELLLFDGQPDVQRKMKKAFCEPGNIEHCPPLTLAAAVVLPYGAAKSLTIKRSADNGGDLTFSDEAGMRDAYGSGALHPGDLKPAARDAVDGVLQRVRDALKADAELGKAAKELEKVAKRLATKKK